MEEKRQEREIKPVWSMDVMILSNINEISKTVSESAIQVETGNLNALFLLRASLIELYDNLKSWLDDGNMIEDNFKKITTRLEKYGYNVEKMPYNEFIQIKMSLYLIKKLLYRARNDLFMKFVVVRTEDDRMKQYSFGRA